MWVTPFPDSETLVERHLSAHLAVNEVSFFSKDFETSSA
jgi:hypothetical protein